MSEEVGQVGEGAGLAAHAGSVEVEADLAPFLDQRPQGSGAGRAVVEVGQQRDEDPEHWLGQPCRVKGKIMVEFGVATMHNLEGVPLVSG